MQDSSIDLGSWQVTGDEVRGYLHAVGDELPIYAEFGIAPPLMLTAKVVGLLLDHLSLPDGAIHSLQDVETIRPPRLGTVVSTTVDVEPARERGGLKFLTVNYSATDVEDGSLLQRGRTTVLLPPNGDGQDSEAFRG